MQVPAAQVHFDASDTRFDESPGQQAAVAEAVLAVFIAEAGFLTLQVEHFSFFGSDQLEGLVIDVAVSAGRLTMLGFGEAVLDREKETTAAKNALFFFSVFMGKHFRSADIVRRLAGVLHREGSVL